MKSSKNKQAPRTALAQLPFGAVQLQGLQGDQFHRRAFGLLLGERFTADEIALVEIDEEAETGLDRRAIGSEVIAIERVAHFQAKAVPAAEAAGVRTGGHVALRRIPTDGEGSVMSEIPPRRRRGAENQCSSDLWWLRLYLANWQDADGG